MSKKITRDSFSSTYIGITVFNQAIFGKFALKRNISFPGHVSVFLTSPYRNSLTKGFGGLADNELPWVRSMIHWT